MCVKERSEKMALNELERDIEKMLEWETLAEDAKAEADAIRDRIKGEMLDRGTEEMEAGRFIVRWTSVLSQRFDSTSFKKAMPDVYKAFTKQVSSKRFSVAA